MPYATRDACTGCANFALQETIENKRLCMRNKIMRSAIAKKMLNLNFCSRKRIKKTYLRCIPLCFSVCLLFHWIFRLNCRTTVTPFIRRHLLRRHIFSSNKVSYFQWSPVTQHQCVHYKGHMSPMACKLRTILYILFSCGEFGLPVVAFDGVEYFMQ